MTMQGPDTQEMVADTPAQEPKKQVATKTARQAAKAFNEARQSPKFLNENKSTMEAFRQKLQEPESSSGMQSDKDFVLDWYPIKRERMPAPEDFQKSPKGFDEIEAKLLEEFSKLNIVDPVAPQEPEKPVAEKTENTYLSMMFGATKTPAEVAYDAKKKAYDVKKAAYNQHHTEMEALKSTLDTLQRNLENLAIFEPSVPEKMVQAELGLSAFKDTEKGMTSQFLSNKHGRNNFAKEIKENRDRAIEAEKQSKTYLARMARTPVPDEVVGVEMEVARERRNLSEMTAKTKAKM